MADFEAACRTVVEKVDGATACGVVDLRSGLLLGGYEPHASDALGDLVAASILELLKGPAIPGLEHLLLPEAAAARADGAFHEVHLASTDRFHFAKAIKNGNCAIVLVTKKTANIGMGWAHLKAVIPTVEPLAP